MKIKTFVTLTIVFLLFSFSCKETPPEPRDGTGSNGMLIVEDVGVTDAVLHLRVPGGFKSRNITLKRLPAEQAGDTTTILTKQIASLDTLVIDENLLPKHSYNYSLTVYTFLNTQERYYAGITTMDTTSHNFTWQVDTLGDGSSLIRDVAIINDTCVWVVGEIYVRDSLGNYDNEPYGAAIWNGVSWKLLKVSYHHYKSTILYPGPLNSLYAFGVNDVYVSSSANLLHWDGSVWEEKAFFMTQMPYTGQVLEIWGANKENLYCGGQDGSIYYVQNTQWQKLDTPPMISSDGIVLDFQDIWGAKNPRTGDLEMMAVASDPGYSADGMIFKISGTEVTKLGNPHVLFRPISGVWFMPGQMYYVVGTKIFKNRDPFDKNYRWNEDTGSYQATYYKTAIRGNGLNDIVVACQRGDLLHYNGVSWVNFKNTAQLEVGHLFHRVAMKGNIIVATGDQYLWYGIVAIGRR